MTTFIKITKIITSYSFLIPYCIVFIAICILQNILYVAQNQLILRETCVDLGYVSTCNHPNAIEQTANYTFFFTLIPGIFDVIGVGLFAACAPIFRRRYSLMLSLLGIFVQSASWVLIYFGPSAAFREHWKIWVILCASINSFGGSLLILWMVIFGIANDLSSIHFPQHRLVFYIVMDVGGALSTILGAQACSWLISDSPATMSLLVSSGLMGIIVFVFFFIKETLPEPPHGGFSIKLADANILRFIWFIIPTRNHLNALNQDQHIIHNKIAIEYEKQQELSHPTNVQNGPDHAQTPSIPHIVLPISPQSPQYPNVNDTPSSEVIHSQSCDGIVDPFSINLETATDVLQQQKQKQKQQQLQQQQQQEHQQQQRQPESHHVSRSNPNLMAYNQYNDLNDSPEDEKDDHGHDQAHAVDKLFSMPSNLNSISSFINHHNNTPSADLPTQESSSTPPTSPGRAPIAEPQYIPHRYSIFLLFTAQFLTHLVHYGKTLIEFYYCKQRFAITAQQFSTLLIIAQCIRCVCSLLLIPLMARFVTQPMQELVLLIACLTLQTITILAYTFCTTYQQFLLVMVFQQFVGSFCPSLIRNLITNQIGPQLQQQVLAIFPSLEVVVIVSNALVFSVLWAATSTSPTLSSLCYYVLCFVMLLATLAVAALYMVDGITNFNTRTQQNILYNKLLSPNPPPQQSGSGETPEYILGEEQEEEYATSTPNGHHHGYNRQVDSE